MMVTITDHAWGQTWGCKNMGPGLKHIVHMGLTLVQKLQGQELILLSKYQSEIDILCQNLRVMLLETEESDKES